MTLKSLLKHVGIDAGGVVVERQYLTCPAQRTWCELSCPSRYPDCQEFVGLGITPGETSGSEKWQYRYQVSTMRPEDRGWAPETMAALRWTMWHDLVEFTFNTMHIHKVEFRRVD